MAMEKGHFEDAFPSENRDISLPSWFNRGLNSSMIEQFKNGPFEVSKKDLAEKLRSM